MIRAVFFDVDETIFSHRTGKVPESTRSAIGELRHRGIIVGLATGRHYLELAHVPMPGVCFDVLLTLNGQLVLDGEGNYIAGNPLTGEALENLVQLFNACELPISLVEKDRIYLNFQDERVEAAQKAVHLPAPPLGSYCGEPIYQAMAYVSDDEARILTEQLPRCNITRWNPYGVDINAPSPGGKADGIARFINPRGIDPSEVVAFGDAENDISMLRFVGTGVCMGNGSPEAKAAADLVTDDIDEDGVVNALRRLGLI